jgi:Sulfotransferase family
MSVKPYIPSTVRIIYIGGYSRSGSTLLLRLLGEFPGLLPVGELFDVWERSYRQNQLCGCGSDFHHCPFWREVTQRALSCDTNTVPVERYEGWRRRLTRRASIAQLWLPRLRSARYRADLHAYAEVLGSLYQAAADVSGARFVIDSSKEPHQAWLLREIPGIELHMIHLVRDSRAVAFSWRRQRSRPEVYWRSESMERRSVLRSALDWDMVNLLTATRRSSLASYTVIRYEDLVGRPEEVSATIARSLGEIWRVDPLGDSRVVSLRRSHTASGNPSRFQTGDIRIVSDDEWRAKMRPNDRLLVSALTAPILFRYGYPLSTSPRHDRVVPQ